MNDIVYNLLSRILRSMKLFVVGVMILFVSGCNETIDPLFEKEAAERVKEKNSELRTLLTSSEYGWNVSYKPSRDETGIFRFNFNFVDDSINGGTVMTHANYVPSVFDLKDTGPSESLYDIFQGSTTKLSFTTSGLLHRLSDSDLSPIPNSAGFGLKGDFEFLYYGRDKNGKDLIFRLNRTSDTILFKKGTPESLDKLKASAMSLSNFSSFLKNLDSKSVYSRIEYTPNSGTPESYDYSFNAISRILTIRKHVKIINNGEEHFEFGDEYKTGIDATGEGVIIDSLRIGESYIKNIVLTYDSTTTTTSAGFTKTFDDGGIIAFEISMSPITSPKGHEKLINPLTENFELWYYHKNSYMPSGLTTLKFEMFFEQIFSKRIDDTDGFFWFHHNKYSNGNYLRIENGSHFIFPTYTYTYTDDRIVFIRGGMLLDVGRTGLATVEHNMFLDFVFDSEGFYVENLGAIVPNSSLQVYTFTSVKDPSLRVAFLGFTRL